MARVYATPDDLAAYPGGADVSAEDAPILLAKAGRFLDTHVFRLCWYLTDDNGMPTDPAVRQALTDAVCAQAAWWDDLGDSTGAMGAGWGNVQVGRMQLGRSVTAVQAEDSAARQVAPEVWDVLASPDLTPRNFRIGEVRTWSLREFL